jgi:hypothetical protein
LRVLLVPNSNPKNWVGGLEDNAALEEIVEKRLQTCVLFQDDNFASLWQSLQDLPLDKREILRSTLSKSVLTKSSTSLSEVTFTNNETITSLRQNPLYEERVKFHSRQSFLGEPRETFFDRTLGHLVAVAREIHIYDRYAFENLSYFRKDNRSGTDWVTWDCLSKLPIKLIINTELPKIKREESKLMYRERLERLKAKVLARVTEQMNRTASTEFRLEINIFELPDDLDSATDGDLGKHDRFGRISFHRNSVSFDMTKGLEIFKGNSMPENFKIHPLESLEIEERIATWQSNSRSNRFFPKNE